VPIGHTWADGVHPDTLGRELHSHGPRESDDGSLCGGVVQHLGRSLKSSDRRSVDDNSSSLDMRYSVSTLSSALFRSQRGM
jgi:hypothetical protein